MTTTTETQGVGGRIKEARAKERRTQDDLARVLDLDKSAISRIEKGERGLAAAELAVLAPFLGVSADFLLFGEQEDEVLFRAEGDAAESVEFARSVIDDLEYVEALLT
jgi:transcriptional regulator with XRE-family HTH domain